MRRATEREHQLTMARTNETTGLTNGRVANWAPEVEFSPFCTLIKNDVPVRLLHQPIKHVSVKRGLIIDKLVFKLRIVFIMNSSSFNSNLTLTVPDSVQLHFLADNM